MKIARISLQPYSRFHFGEFKIDVDLGLSSTSAYAHSDTLFSALANSYSVFDDADNFVHAFVDSRLNISSLFYYLKHNTQLVLFLPKPVFLENDSKIDGHHKVRNKIKFVSLNVWESGFNQDDWLDPSKFVIIQNEFVVTRDEFNQLISGTNAKEINIYKTVQSPKSPNSRTAPKDSIFYQTDISISHNKGDIETGFYFMYQSGDAASEMMLRNATNLMAKSGIGGERNNMGRIMGDPFFEEFDFELNSTTYATISLVSPNEIDEFRKMQFYKMIIRGGRSLNHGGKYQAVRLIQEGAKLSGTISGRLIEIGKDDNNKIAYRNGKAFLIPVLP